MLMLVTTLKISISKFKNSFFCIPWALLRKEQPTDTPIASVYIPERAINTSPDKNQTIFYIAIKKAKC